MALDDELVSAWLGKNFPKALDGKLTQVQTALQGAVGSLACAWSGIVENDLRDSRTPAGEGLDII